MQIKHACTAMSNLLGFKITQKVCDKKPKFISNGYSCLLSGTAAEARFCNHLEWFIASVRQMRVFNELKCF